MAKALPGGIFPRLVSVVVMSCMVLLPACGGSSSIQHDSIDSQAPHIPQQPGSAFPNLDFPSSNERQASSIPSALQLDGSAYRPDLPGRGVVDDGTVAVFTPETAGGSIAVAYAIYEFDLSMLEDPHAPFGVEIIPDGTVDGAVELYVGLGDTISRRYHWAEPLLSTDGRGILSWSWGMSQSGSSAMEGTGTGAVRGDSYLPVVVLVSGAQARIASLAIRASDSPVAGGTIAFSKGWDGTVKGSTRRVDLEADSDGTLNASYYDDSNGQLYHLWQAGRLWTTQAMSCFGDNGSSHDLLVSPGGGLWMAFYETDSASGGLLTMAPENVEQKLWLPSNFRFETGDDGSGTLIEAGANPSVAFDDDGFPHVFYECASTGRIRHAWQELGTIDWLHEYISPDGEVEGQPIAFNTPYGVYCLTRKGWDGCIYGPDRKGTKVYEGRLIPGDMHNPLDPESDQAFFDAVCRDSTVVIAMACTGGQRLVRFDLDTEEIVQDFIYNDDPAGGCFLDLEVLGDGSVRIAQYNAVDRMIYFETGDIPGEEQFISLPAVQYGEDQDCDGLAFWVDDSAPTDSPRDAFLVELSYSPAKIKIGDGVGKKEFKGHVTLMK